MFNKVDALKEIVTPYKEFKKSNLFLEFLTGESSLAATNEVKYAFEHIVTLIDDAGEEPEKLDAEITKIKHHLSRATKDNLELALISKMATLEELSNSSHLDKDVIETAKELEVNFQNIYKEIHKPGDEKQLYEATSSIISEIDKIEMLNDKYNLMLSMEKRDSVFNSFKIVALGAGASVLASLVYEFIQRL